MNSTTFDSRNGQLSTTVDWDGAPDLVTVPVAAFLMGVDVHVIDHLIDMAGVDAVDRDGETLVVKATLLEFREIYRDATGEYD